jgi:glycosyltransferase involved in cell wall biosynthesis
MPDLRPIDFARANPAQSAPRLALFEPCVAVLIPCFNEAMTIQTVVAGFCQALPKAGIYVYDNNSTDETVNAARQAGAIVRSERRQGKGNVVRRMFSDIDADCYILVDGDGTYDPAAAESAVSAILDESCDFVNIARVATENDAYRPGHRFGNRLLSELVRFFFGRQSTDMLSGYKALSRRFVKSFPAMSFGFETETELTVHALEMRMPMAEISAPYHERPSGSVSKLRTYSDGVRILMLIARMIKDERPLQFFAAFGFLLIFVALLLGMSITVEFIHTGLVPRLPTAVLSVGLVLLGWLCVFAGLILDVVTKARREIKRLAYLSIPPQKPTLSPE